MNRVIGIFLLLVWASAGAEVFRQVGPDGAVTFSDTAAPGAERVDLPPAQTISLPPVRPRVTATQRDTDAGKASVSYSRLQIVAPAQGEGIRANDGYVSVTLESQPALAPGHTVELLVSGEDGERRYNGTSMQIELGGLSRGAHTILARIRNERGEQLAQSASVSFSVLRVAVGGRRPR